MLTNCTSQEQPLLLAALEKYSVAAFYYLCGKGGVAALEKYSVAAFYYLCGKRGVAALEK
jgi:hypothetical protein